MAWGTSSVLSSRELWWIGLPRTTPTAPPPQRRRDSAGRGRTTGTASGSIPRSARSGCSLCSRCCFGRTAGSQRPPPERGRATSARDAPSRAPLSRRYRRNERVQPRGRELQRPPLLGAQVGGHQQPHDVETVVTGDLRRLALEEHPDDVAGFRFRARGSRPRPPHPPLPPPGL